MKDKTRYILKVYKHNISQFLYVGVSILVGFVTFLILFTIANDLYDIPLLRWVIRPLAIAKNFFGDFIYIVIGAILVVIFYVLFTYRKSKKIASLMESVEIMSAGNLDKRIDIDSNSDVGKVASDINHIVERLKSITVEERQAQQTKTDLITNVSHDLRTPLTSIIGYLDLIENDKYKDEVHLRYYTKIAYEKAKSLDILINDLFELTKLQNNTLPLDKIEINLVELVGQVVSYLEYQVREANMKIRLNFSDDKLIINGDPNKLVRVFENLISNAVKYGNEGIYIDIVTKKENNFAIVQVINYGKSIPKSEIPFIFDRFYRIEKSRSRDDGGSGLGLAIAKNIIEIHGGDILVESNGSEVIFETKIPLVKN